MKGLLSNLCLGCIAGVTIGVILVSIILSLLFNLSFTAKELLSFYGIAMLVGTVIGAVAGWINCYRCQSKDSNHHANS